MLGAIHVVERRDPPGRVMAVEGTIDVGRGIPVGCGWVGCIGVPASVVSIAINCCAISLDGFEHRTVFMSPVLFGLLDSLLLFRLPFPRLWLADTLVSCCIRVFVLTHWLLVNSVINPMSKFITSLSWFGFACGVIVVGTVCGISTSASNDCVCIGSVGKGCVGRGVGQFPFVVQSPSEVKTGVISWLYACCTPTTTTMKRKIGMILRERNRILCNLFLNIAFT